MAATRKSAAQLAARERAREKAAEITRRHERLIELAADYFEAEADEQRILEEAQAAAAAILAKAEQDAAEAAGRAGAVVAAMLATGESRAGVASRLGISAAEVKRAAEAAAPDGGDAVGPSTEAAERGSAEEGQGLAEDAA